MFAIAFDLTVAEIECFHPRSVAAAYAEIGRALSSFFQWKQESMYTGEDEDMANLFAALNALRTLPWFL